MRRTLTFQVFLAAVVAALLSVFATGIVVRLAFSGAFREYLAAPRRLGMMGQAPIAGRGTMMGAAERAFTTAMDQGIVLAAILAVVLAGLAAFWLARRTSRSLGELKEAAQSLAEGDLAMRVEVGGPAEVVELGEAFNEMADSLERSEALRRRLVADVAHELRNPIASVRAQAEGMAEGVLPVDASRLGSVVEDLEHLSMLVDDLQELTVAEAGRLAYDFVRADVTQLISREAARARELAAPGVEVLTECAEGVSEVDADVQRISQVLRNMLVNAVRHTTEGTVTVRCMMSAEGVTVEIEDTGEGIPGEDLPYIFERFYRADSARTRERGGAGIGLAIARRIVEDHGGRVFAQSAVGVGTRIGFTLPRAAGRD